MYGFAGRSLFAVCLVTASLAFGCSETGGTCDPACGDFMDCCDGTCVLLATDSTHCGGCGNTCAPGQRCEGSTCVAGLDAGFPSMCRATCAADQQCCGTSCVNTSVAPETNGRSDSSFDHCGTCGNKCEDDRASACSIPGGGSGGTPRCACGVLAQCLEGQVCVPSGGSFTCVDLSSDAENCGEVGNACVDDEICVDGACECGTTGARCGSGSSCCGGGCISTVDDAANCGGCDVVCTPNAPDCEASACVCAASGRACDAATAGFGGFGGDLGESCCPGMGCVTNDEASCNCMACDVSGGETCQVGGSGIIPTPGGDEAANVCCGDFLTPLLGCGGFGFPGGDGGIPFPSFDGGFGFPLDGGFPSFDASIPGFDASIPSFDGGVPFDAGI